HSIPYKKREYPMIIQTKNILRHLLYAFLPVCAITSAFANPHTAIHFSPYADLTINTTWSNQYNDMEPMDLTAISKASGISEYHLAFITDAGNCTPAWGGQSSYSVNKGWGSHLTDKLHANSIHSIISFGGATGSD